VRNIEALVSDAHRTSKALNEGDFDTFANCLKRYWCQKKIMAGNESGAEPEVVRCVLAELFRQNEIVAGSLCGAGGGGFMVLITAKGRTMMDVKSTFDKAISHLNEDATSFTWHECHVSSDGLRTFQSSTSDEFDISWHCV
jgi:fucokinase